MNIGYTNCSAPGWSGYSPSCRDCVFDTKEEGFSRAVGRLWTNLAASGDPGKDRYTAVTQEAHPPASSEWPAYRATVGPMHARNVLLVPEHHGGLVQRMESEASMGRGAFCKVWDQIALAAEA